MRPVCSALTSIMALIGSPRLAAAGCRRNSRGCEPVELREYSPPALHAREHQEAQRLHPAIGMSLSRKVPSEASASHGHYPAGDHRWMQSGYLCTGIRIFSENILIPLTRTRWLNEASMRAMERFNLTWEAAPDLALVGISAELIVHKAVSAPSEGEFNLDVTMPEEKDIRYYFMAMLTGVKSVLLLPKEGFHTGPVHG